LDVDVNGHTFVVMVEEATLQRLGGESPEVLVEASFKFLLDKEPITSILSKFNLEQINQYFPSYETDISNYF